MEQEELRERVQARKRRLKPQAGKFGVLRFDPNAQRSKRKLRRRVPAQEQHVRVQTRQRQVEQRGHEDARVQHEIQEMREKHDLREVDDDVEDVATLLEWRAVEHNHQPKSRQWFVVLAVTITVASVALLLLGNIIGAITIAFAGGFIYWIAQREPDIMRYRILTEGVAFNNTLYHYQDLQAFNVVYEPGLVKTVILRSNRTFAPLLHMEIGDTDPVAIRDILLEFVEEDQELYEPLVDIYARRLGF